MAPVNKYFIDGMDFWQNFGVIVERGSDGFLKYPSKKDSITHDWSDANGLDVDLSKIFFSSRDITLQCALIANDEADFWRKYNAFIYQWQLPGKHRIQVSELGFRSFYCFYKETNSFERFTRVKVEQQNKIACKFSLSIVEVEPTLQSDDTFIVDEDGRFLIT